MTEATAPSGSRTEIVTPYVPALVGTHEIDEAFAEAQPGGSPPYAYVSGPPEEVAFTETVLEFPRTIVAGATWKPSMWTDPDEPAAPTVSVSEALAFFPPASCTATPTVKFPVPVGVQGSVGTSWPTHPVGSPEYAYDSGGVPSEVWTESKVRSATSVGAGVAKKAVIWSTGATFTTVCALVPSPAESVTTTVTVEVPVPFGVHVSAEALALAHP
ncbi:MAG: hypothetical protein L3J81_03740, partial [Thermoplasmata archaeon]|nr:hypothetical protein [Thermoplasmata archaeon]